MISGWKIMNSRAGVSLVTVLLFMLVATIAATATFKWLTSENRSSGSRMQQQEAYQSAIAGIESARSWMMYNANETGAIIKQYKDGNNAPVKLTDRLAAFVRPGQNYDVYLVGVNADPTNPTYKVKILAEGVSRNGEAKHSEIAVLNIKGLYQVKVPVEETHTTIDFDYAYFGGSYNGAGDLELSSAIVNGNWEGNPQNIHGNFVVTGYARLTGNNVNLGPLACVGGDFLPENNGLKGGNLYVGGNVNGNMQLDSNAYFEGNVSNKDGGKFDIKGSVTLNGTMSPLPSLDFKIHKNFCTTEDGVVRSAAGTDASHKAFVVEGNVWMPGDMNVAYGKATGSDCRCKKKTVVSYWPMYVTKYDTVSCNYGDWGMIDCQVYGVKDASNDNYESYQKIKLGEKKESDVYIKTGHPWSDYNTLKDGKTITTHASQIRNCKSNDCKGSADHENWKENESLSPYVSRAQKPDLYYIYSLPAGVTDVSYGEYYDSYWKADVYGFFVNALNGAKNEETRFTDSYNTFYRYLNYENGNIVGSPYCKKMDGKNFVPGCSVSPWFTTKGNFHNNLPATKPFECAETVKERCDALWEKTDGCDGASYLVKDPLVTAKDKFEPYASFGCAATITTYNTDLVTQLNNCYKQLYDDEDKRKDSLYNDFLVVKVSGGTTSTNPGGKLKGKFIVIATEALYTSFMDVEDDSYVFYFLEKGINTLNDATRKNTFIYTTDHIGSGNQFHLTGTIYATASSCADMEKLQSSSITYDPNVMSVLTKAKVICANDGSVCGGTASESSDPATTTTTESYSTGGYDNYYIALAPQLSVTLESQYKNNETVSSANASDVSGSFIVLPRVIYLSRNAKGKLENYYNVIPLNTANPVAVNSVTCNNGLSTSGKLVSGDAQLAEGDYACRVVGTVQTSSGAVQQTVPFWVRVKGSGSSQPVVSFVGEPTQKVSLETSTSVTLSMPGTSGGGTQTCQVEISISGDVDEWTVDPETGVEPAGTNVYSTTVTSGSPLDVFTVTNSASNAGAIYLSITNTDACTPGSPKVLYNANTAPIERKSIAEYCTDYPAEPTCQTGGDYYQLKDRPDCSESGEWVTINGTACSINETNNKWSCAISGDVSLRKVKDVAGCDVVIAPVTHEAPLTVNKNPPYYLYASLKKIPLTFSTGFSVDGSIEDSRTIKIHVEDDDGSRDKTCSYSDFKDESRRETNCNALVYHGSVVTLSLEPENPADFNYWMCEAGADCPDDEAHPELSYQITVTADENVVYAHFGENDRHCFFDEFKEPTRGEGYRHNRDYIECGHNTDYCIDYCEDDGNRCSSNLTTSSYPNAKWRLVSASTATMGDIDYSVVDSRISLKSSATRGKKEANKRFAIVMSSVQAGIYGTLKAQFMLPREGVSAGDIAMATSRNSGFVLRSNPTVSSFLMLNVFAASDGKVKARVCLNGEVPCSEAELKRNGVAYSPSERHPVVLVAATLGTQSGNDVLNVELYSSAWTNEPYSTTFTLTNDVLSGVSSTATPPNEYVGYALSDQNFKIYAIGWKSDSYRSTCWDTYPVLSCSFKAAYPTGVVPKGVDAEPWVGFSAWFDAVAKGCQKSDVGYYYKGNDACGGTGSTYNSCGSAYRFSETGAHGYMDGENEVRMAKVDIDNCSVYGEEAAWAKNKVAASCGSFWVGEMNACSRHHSFESTVSGSEGDYFGLASGTANLRGATLKVGLNNPDGKNVEIYMFSQNTTSGYTYGNSHIYSQPYVTNRAGNNITVEIPVADLLNSEGFDPENVVGVYVQKFGESSVEINSVISSCPNAVEVTGCTASYSEGQWNVKATVKNKGYTDHIKVVETHSYISDPSELNCDYQSSDDASKCSFTGDDAVFGWTDNPYLSHAEDPYRFKVTLTSTEGTTSEFECDASAVGKIVGTCGAISTTSVVQAKGVPQFTYSISNCPDNNCGYKVELVKNSSVVMTVTPETTGGNVSTQTASTATNTSNDNKLDEGTYKFRLSSTNSSRPFTTCESNEFTVTPPGAITANCAFTGTVVKSGSATLQMTNIVNVEQSTGITIERSGADPISGTLTSNDDKSISITAPDAAGAYTYTVNYTDPVSSATKKVCDATLTVVEGLACEVSTTSITLGETFTFTPSYGGSCTSASLTGNGTITGSGCSVTSFTVEPNSAGSQEYTYTFSGDIGSNLTCKQTVTVNPPAPEFSCPANWGGIATASGGSAALTLSPTYCDNNSCTMKITGIDDDFVAFSSPRTLTDASVTTSTNKTYTIAIKNGTGTTSQNCPITYTYDGPTATTCQFDNASRVYGEKGKFKVDKLKVTSGVAWELDDPNGTKVLDGTYTSDYNSSYWETGEFRVKVNGTYTLKLGGSSACTANLTVTQPTAENCRLDAETIPSGNSTKFHWDLKNCKDSQCSYMIKLAGSDFHGEDNVSEQNDRQKDVSTAGEYVVWLNGVETNCKKTLTIAAGGTLTCSISEYLETGATWQKIKVTSTRPTSTYDVWLDGVIGKNTNGDNMTNITINKDASNVDVGGFTCASGAHTYKITANGSTTALCNGSFTCIAVPKVDCYFIYNNGGATVTSAVSPNTQIQFCATRAAFSKQTTLTGKKKDGDINDSNFWLSKDQERVCYYFEAPSSSGSYTFKVRANDEDACNSNPVLVVQ